MRIKKLFVIILVATILGLCAGILMEYIALWEGFPIFIISGALVGVFSGITVEILSHSHSITREDLRKMESPVLRILVATAVGLLVGSVLEYVAVWAVFPIFLISGALVGVTVGIIIEVIRYNRLMRCSFLESKGLRLEHLPAGSAEFIKLVIKKMRYRENVRSEVLAELISHFQDGLMDCKTDREKEQAAQRLITEFGDVKLLAVLLRRAKKRCRPLWRTVVARTFQTVGVLILCFIIYAVWFSTGRPTISVDYLAVINQMNRPQVRDEDNAWPHYQKAMALYVEPDQRVSKLIGRSQREFKRKLYFSDLDKDKQEKIYEWLKENESFWENLDLSRKQLIGRCFKEGLVPLPYQHERSLTRLYPYYIGHYWAFDAAIKDILWRIERRLESGRLESTSEYEYEMMMEMQSQARPKRLRGDIRLVPDAALDSEVIAWFGAHSRKELEDIERGIEAVAIKQWMNSPPVVAKSVFDFLLPFEKELIVKWTLDNKAAWQEFVAGTRKSYCYLSYAYDPNREDEMLWLFVMPPLRKLRALVWVGIWRLRINLEQGRIQQNIEDYLAIARAGSHWQGDGTLIEQLVGLALGRLAYEEIFHILATQRLSAAELEHLQHQLLQLYPQGYPAIDMEGERLAFLDVVQRSFTDGGPGGGHLIPRRKGFLIDMYEDIVEITDDIPVGKRFFGNAALTSMCLLHARRDETVAMGERIYNQQAKIVRMSPYERHAGNLRSGDEILSSVHQYRYFLLHYLIPAAERCSDIAYRGKALHEAAVAILALKQWHLKKNEYPAGLNDLVTAGFLKELPMDPYSDKQLVYKRIDDDFMLYSLGCNFKDDGGKIVEERGDMQKWGSHDDGDAVFWPVPKSQLTK